ncbi:ubiquinol--cytochrome-c reductase subunit 8 [Pestalotiopsis sp. 9143b]|nr:ubiquinol--cytochrome-c reductase subunit 8 [Pestalotiopsis sp. 9143b]
MQPTQILRGGGESPLGRHGHYLGGWGNFGGLKQKGIITYGLSSNRQNPVAGAAHDAIFNTWRRISKQILYVAPPFIGFYYAMEWATHRNHYLNSKQGRAEFGEEE